MSPLTYNSKIPIVEQYAAATVIGLGATGFSVVRYLRARGMQVAVVDSRLNPPFVKQLDEQYPDVALHSGNFSEVGFPEADLLVTSPGVSLAEPFLRKAKRRGAHVVGDIELFIQENTRPLIAITGSNGKSTVTALVGEMCEAGGLGTLVAGNIGLPALDALTDRVDYRVAVLELSSFQLEATSQVPAEAVAILNVSADHMDRYDSMGDYLLAKARILRGAKRVVLPRHDEQLQQFTGSSKVRTFALDAPSSDGDYGIKRFSNHRWLVKGQNRLIKLRQIPLLGLHNVENVLAAFALVEFLDLPLKRLVSAVQSFAGLPHRMQTVRVNDEVTWVNDSKATNVGSTSTALRNLEEDIIWIAGGQGKGADFHALRPAIHKKVKMLILLGEDADKIISAVGDLLPVKRVSTMRQAVEVAGREAAPKSVVLLSPACASFDMYRNYEHRGEDFAKQVNAWIERSAA
ncbi:MAG: UDP-N-acetylmuramoyl-L-alanine--D-glutamate ligase [Gammaproteobacteria bacterium]|nr:UDP-N-acetylmuramoyl-L-alanine--D-glutamate ligase [Gammaproteobacteria bacterium]